MDMVKQFDMFPQRQILSVSQIVHQIRFCLETEFRDIWVQGEISNFRSPSSGHCYFTLKDGDAQVRAVCFRTQTQYLKFTPEDGMDVMARGSITVYPPRGEFQLVVETMEPLGQGALQLAFEQLKQKLHGLGWFESSQKKPLPLFPSKIGVVTSPSGAALHDILRVLQRRNDRLNILIAPVHVQGTGAALEIAGAVRYLNTRTDIDVIIVARGGGGLEDLWAFNEEPLARALHESALPVISAVGHETDFTIADFVADIRAATPSAAAELVCGAQTELCARVDHLVTRSSQATRFLLQRKKYALQRLTGSRTFVDAESRLRFFLQRLDELNGRLLRTVPLRIPGLWQSLERDRDKVIRVAGTYLQSRRLRHKSAFQQLQAFSPLAILERGYAIVTHSDGQVVRRPEQLETGQAMKIRVSGGTFRARKESDEL